MYLDKCICTGQKLQTRRYDKEVRKNKDRYKTKEWRILTACCKDKFKGIDIYILYTKGKAVRGKLSHHIIEIEEDESRIYDINNLIYLSEKSHKLIHKLYKTKEKKLIQDELFNLVKRFETEYLQ